MTVIVDCDLADVMIANDDESLQMYNVLLCHLKTKWRPDCFN